MTPEFQIIQQIRELIQSDMLERNPVLEDFAEQFAEICHEANQRLQRCADYLNKGMRSEAVHEASSSPNLMELADAIDFPELKKWRNICLDLELATFSPLSEEILDRLRRECTLEEDLAPLLTQYRRAVYQADRDECIRLLRELRERDPNNPSWPQNLRPLEESRLPEVVEQARTALAEDDLYSLKAVYAELTHPQRAATAPSGLLAEVKHALLGERREETMRQGATLAARLDKALEAKDAGSVDALMAAWEKLAADEAFEPTPDMNALIGRARDAQQERQHEDELEAKHQSHIEAMWAVLEEPKADEGRIRHEWDNLLAAGREVPERLTVAVDSAIARRVAARRHRRNLAVLAVVIVLLTAAVGLGIFAYVGKQERLQAAIIAKIEKMDVDQEYVEMDSYLESLRENRPEIYQLPEISQYVDKARAVLVTHEEMDNKFAGLMEELARVRQNEYVLPAEQIQSTIDEARPVARTPEAKKLLRDWEVSWNAWKARHQKATDDALVRSISEIREILSSRQSRPFQELAMEGAALDKLTELIKQGTAILPNASTKHVETFNELSAQYDGWKRDYEQRLRKSESASERLLELRKSLPTALPDLDRYFALAKEVVDEFPHEPEPASLKHILDRKENYLQAVSLAGFQLAQLPPPQEAVVQISKWLAGPLQDSVWQPDLRQCLDYAGGCQRVRASLPILLRENKELGLKVFYVRAKGKVDWQPVYYPDTIASRQLEDEDGNPYDMYFGRIYWFGARDQKPFLTHTKDVFPDGLTTQLYDIRIQREERDNMVPHGKFLYSFVARGTTAREMDVYLLQGMKRLLATEDIEPVPRALVLKRLVAFTSKGFPNIPELDTMQQITAKLQTEVPWLNPENLEVMQANQDIRAALKRFPDIDAIIAQLNAEHELLALALSRRLTCVGSMQRTDGGELAPRFVRRPPAEVWTLTATATGARCYFRVAGAVREDGTLRVNKGMEGDLVPGQLLFAPGDGRSTLELQKKLVKPGMELPACWPTNTAE